MAPAAKAARTIRRVGQDASPWAAIAAIAFLIVEQRTNATPQSGPTVVEVKLEEMSKDLDSIITKLDPLLQKVTGLDVRMNALEQWRAAEDRRP